MIYRSKRIFSSENNYYYSYLFIAENTIHVFSSNPMFASDTRIIGFDDKNTLENLEAILASSNGLTYTNEDGTIEFSMLIKLAINTGELVHITRYYIATKNGKNLKLEARDENNEPLSYEEEFELLNLELVT